MITQRIRPGGINSTASNGAAPSNTQDQHRAKLAAKQYQPPKTVGSVSLQQRYNGGLTLIQRTYFAPGKSAEAELLLATLLAWREGR
jgi:hypothetical protein